MPNRIGPSGSGADPAVASYAVTPSDSVYLPQGPCRSLYIGVTGDVSLVSQQIGTNGNAIETAVLFKAVPVGTLPVGCLRVNNTNTTASLIIALY